MKLKGRFSNYFSQISNDLLSVYISYTYVHAAHFFGLYSLYFVYTHVILKGKATEKHRYISPALYGDVDPYDTR